MTGNGHGEGEMGSNVLCRDTVERSLEHVDVTRRILVCKRLIIR